MFKLLAGISIIFLMYSDYKNGLPSYDGSHVCLSIAIALIGSGLDSIYYFKKRK